MVLFLVKHRKAFSAVHIEDCEGWWLPSSHTTPVGQSVVYRLQKLTVRYKWFLQKTNHRYSSNCSSSVWSTGSSSYEHWNWFPATDIFYTHSFILPQSIKTSRNSKQLLKWLPSVFVHSTLELWLYQSFMDCNLLLRCVAVDDNQNIIYGRHNWHGWQVVYWYIVWVR